MEILKDLVAKANTGGGAILFGVKNNGGIADFDDDPVTSTAQNLGLLSTATHLWRGC